MNLRYDMAKLVIGAVNVGMILYSSVCSGLTCTFGLWGIAAAVGILCLAVKSVSFIKKNESIWMFVLVLFVTFPFNVRLATVAVEECFVEINVFSKILYIVMVCMSLLSAEEIFIGLLTRFIWPRQDESFISELKKIDENIDQNG